MPILLGDGSENANCGAWQEAQDIELSPLILFSQNRCLPSLTPSTVSGFSSGISTGGKLDGMFNT